MNLLYKITVYGEPVAQGRARARVVKAKGIEPYATHYDPAKSRQYKVLVRNHVYLNKPQKLLDCPLILSCKIYRSKPRSKPKKVVYPTTKPDLSNYLKGIEDALCGLVYRDDSLIVGYKNIYKLYDSDSPRVEIELYSTNFIKEGVKNDK